MTLVTACTSCKEEIKIKSNALTRPDLAMEKGDEFGINCPHCGKYQKKHVNDISARQNNFIIIGGIGLGIIVTLIMWNLFGLIGTISATIPLLIWKQQANSAQAFNSYRTKR